MFLNVLLNKSHIMIVKIRCIFTNYISFYEELTKGSCITVSIFFSACAVKSAKRVRITYSPGLCGRIISAITSNLYRKFNSIKTSIQKCIYINKRINYRMRVPRIPYCTIVSTKAVEKNSLRSP